MLLHWQESALATPLQGTITMYYRTSGHRKAALSTLSDINARLQHEQYLRLNQRARFLARTYHLSPGRAALVADLLFVEQAQ
jgi:hypothetical protein